MFRFLGFIIRTIWRVIVLYVCPFDFETLWRLFHEIFRISGGNFDSNSEDDSRGDIFLDGIRGMVSDSSSNEFSLDERGYFCIGLGFIFLIGCVVIGFNLEWF